MTNLHQSIQQYVDSIVDEISKNAPSNTGALANSISGEVVQTSNGYEISISMLDYGKFQDEGVNGTIKKWGSRFSFTDKQPPSISMRGYASTASGQFLIARSIKQNGIKPRNFIQPVLNRSLDELANKIADATANDIIDTLDK